MFPTQGQVDAHAEVVETDVAKEVFLGSDDGASFEAEHVGERLTPPLPLSNS